MGSGHLSRVVRIFLGVVGVFLAAGFLGAGALTSVSEAYPADFVKREALARCTANDARFFRFSSHDRATCYSSLHVPGYPQTLTR